MSNQNKQTLHVISNTHWDREWHLPFDLFRMRLVGFNDRLLDIMEQNAEFRHYQMDGQYQCVEDYLEMRPEMRERMVELVKEKRILIGPWYSLPDMNLTDGETIIRNLQTGIRLSDAMGGAMRTAYTACSNGQIAQLPQIYGGFGITSGLIYKGLHHDHMPKEFLWESPDGTRLFTIQMANTYGRANFYCLVYHQVIGGVFHRGEDHNWCYRFDEGRLPFRRDRRHYGNTGTYETLHDREDFLEEHLKSRLEELREQASRNSDSNHHLAFNGMDHTPPLPATPKLIAAANAALDDLNVVDSSLPEALAQIMESVDFDKLAVHRGEFRDVKQSSEDRQAHIGTLSSRMDIKAFNRQVEHALIHTTEPLAAWAWLKGLEYPTPFLKRAWKLLLSNHSHDSIDGCSVDSVNDKVLDRYRTVHAISEGLAEKSLGHILTTTIEIADDAGDAVPCLMVANPSLHARGGLCEVEIDLPEADESTSVSIVDGQGQTVASQVESLGKRICPLEGFIRRPMEINSRVRALFPSGTIPAMAARHFRVVTGATGVVGESISTEDRVMENEHLAVTIQSNGCLDVTHKATGRLYAGANYFADEGDVGDPWKNVPVADTYQDTLGQSAEITCVENGPLRATYEVKTQLPDGTVTLTSRVSLSAGSRRVDIETEVGNTRKDHRLTACIPTGITSDVTYSSAPFEVSERATELPDMSSWPERISGYPNHGFFGLSDGEAGMAVLNIGLPEYLIDQKSRDTLTLTLLRCSQLRQWPDDSRAPQLIGTQCLGTYKFNYALYPHSGNWQDGDLFREYESFAQPLTAAQYFAPEPCRASESFISLDSATLEWSCVKRAEDGDGLILRLWNPLDDAQDGIIRTANPVQGARFVNLNEEELTDGDAPEMVDDRTIKVSIGGRKIATLLLTGLQQ
jgi:2-O-(6-phospho-alpha-D-mannosyl)-D-glycerate hydrolase